MLLNSSSLDARALNDATTTTPTPTALVSAQGGQSSALLATRTLDASTQGAQGQTTALAASRSINAPTAANAQAQSLAASTARSIGSTGISSGQTQGASSNASPTLAGAVQSAQASQSALASASVRWASVTVCGQAQSVLSSTDRQRTASLASEQAGNAEALFMRALDAFVSTAQDGQPCASELSRLRDALTACAQLQQFQAKLRLLSREPSKFIATVPAPGCAALVHAPAKSALVT